MAIKVALECLGYVTETEVVLSHCLHICIKSNLMFIYISQIGH